MDYNKALEWRAGPGICRCCLSEGCYKDISTEYFWMGEKEIYGAMLLECFDITISYQEGKANGSSRLICEVCITRLRDAANFKKQVANSEKNFVKHIAARQACSSVKPFNHFQLKELHEDVKDEQDDSDYGLEDLFDASNSDNDTGETVTKVEPIDSGFDMNTEATVKKVVAIKRPLVMKEEEVPPKKVKQSAKLPAPRAKGRPSDRRIELHEKDIVFENAMTIIRNTNACPFRYFNSSFKCFYCDDFSNPTFAEISEHTAREHADFEFFYTVNYMRKAKIISLNTSNWSCSICEDPLSDVDSAVQHLREAHDIKFHYTTRALFLPFEIDNDSYVCAFCGESHRTFYSLNKHINAHTTQNVCDVCGKSFVTEKRLRTHRRMHYTLKSVCKECGEVFDKQHLKIKHMIKEHSFTRLKCALCPERFMEHRHKVKHMRIAHDMHMKFTCVKCGKSYDNEGSLSNHRRNAHHSSGLFSCCDCDKTFPSNAQLKRHSVSHTGQRNFPCLVCKKAFGRQCSLREHMRIHNNDRRFVCAECSMSFIQKCSLKSHIKVRHPHMYE